MLRNHYLKSLFHPAFDIIWGMVGKRKKQRAVIGIIVSTRGRLVVETRMDIIHHHYIIMLHIWKLDRQDVKKRRRIRIANVNANSL